MVIELCGGTPSEIVVAGKVEAPEKVIDFPTSELKRLAGLDLPFPRCAACCRSSASSSPARTAA